MFKIEVSPSYLYPVEIKMLDEKGKEKPMGFKAKFKRLAQDEIEDVLKRIDEKDINDHELVSTVLIGWQGVQDEAGKELEFHADNMDAVLNIHPVQARIAEAWFNSLAGAQR
ncbi:MAG: hypothetical protein R8M45_11385, partial [Ghiorsea sp.]